MGSGVRYGVLFAIAFALLPTSAQAQSLEITTQPALYPAFDPAIPDYVVRCSNGTPVGVNVTAPAGTQVDVDGQGPSGGTFARSVRLRAGQGFGIKVTSGPTPGNYNVRCLPSDFPRSAFQRSGTPQAEWYAVAPLARTTFEPPPSGVSISYVTLFDRNGVPVWWMNTPGGQADFRAFPNGNLAWHVGLSGADERRLDGSLVRRITAAQGEPDPHEIMLLPNGNYLLNTARTVNGPTPCTPADAPILDTGSQEVRPDGSLVWAWWAADHIAPSEMDPVWCDSALQNGKYDLFHINSIEPDGDGFIMSFRHLDAVYRVRKVDGVVTWKLGGTTRPQSLTVLNDPLAAGGATFRGQHDPRVLSDGTVTVHDNGFRPNAQRDVRAVRYAIDTNAMTATLVEQKNDPAPVNAPLCCGSSRKLPGGNWLMSWGSSGLVTELSPSGDRVFSLTFDPTLFSYRAHPVPFGLLSRDALRAGMDAQHPRGFVRPLTAGQGRGLRFPLVPAYRQCLSPNRQHGPPLAHPSCSSPAGTSNFLTVGPTSTGNVMYGTVVGNSATPANEADVTLRASLTDVRWKSDQSDYRGHLVLGGSIRITDQFNGSLRNESATGLDTEFPVTVQCTSTADPAVGGSCSLTTTVNAVVPGTVVEGKRAMWQVGQLKVYDGGGTGLAGASGATLFQTQGLFVP